MTTMASFETPTVHPVVLHAPERHRAQARAVYDDNELLLSAILPAARFEHVGASAVPGALSKGDLDICVLMARESFHEALGVLGEAGFTLRSRPDRAAPRHILAAPLGEMPLMVHLVEEGRTTDPLIAFRDALRADPALVERYNAVRLEAAARGATAYRAAKAGFIADVLERLAGG
jgi:GrpB-like predicted nucleotidyltransferase (UPF0157 family)